MNIDENLRQEAMRDVEQAQKRIFIKDPVWGNIELFPWEKKLLNQNLLNRLHHVVQVSSGFRVYPGLRHTRFLHSIGVLHVVTNMYYNAVKNTPYTIKSYQNKNDSKAESYTVALCQFKSETERLTAQFTDMVGQDSLANLNQHNQTFNLNDSYFCILCILRVAALLHDVGHLPYSHILETVIESVIEEIDLEPQSRGLDLKPDTLRLCEDIKKSLGRPSGTKALHECLGRQISLLLEKRFRNTRHKHIEALIYCSSRLLHTPDYPLFRSLLVGSVDADRIDYVKRDGYFSGLYQSSVDYNRLFSAYEFAYNYDDLTKVKDYFSKPSPMATSESEKLVLERFQLYRNALSHHRVHLFDEILLRIVRMLISKGSLDSFLNSIDKLLKLESHTLDRLLENLRWDNIPVELAQIESSLKYCFDDSWLDCTIREAVSRANSSDDSLIFLYDSTFEDRGLLKSFHKGKWGSFIDQDIENDLLALVTHLEGRSRELAANPETLRFTTAMGISEDVCGSKFKMERDIVKEHHEQLRFLIIGDMEHRLSLGMKSEENAQLLGLENLLHFLRSKHSETIPYNVWFALTDKYEGDLEGMDAQAARKSVKELLRKVGQAITTHISKQRDLLN